MRYLFIVFGFAAMIIFLIGEGVGSADVIFEDNFDGHSDWTVEQPIYPYTQAASSTDGALDQSTACTNCPDGTAKYAGYYSSSSAWNGYKGNNTLNIDSTNARGGTGKALTLWMEPIDSTFCDGGTGYCSDGQLAVALGTEHDEIFIRYYIKFQSDYAWKGAGGKEPGQKFLHVTNYDPDLGAGMFRFFQSGSHFPIAFHTLGTDDWYYSDSSVQFKQHYRYQSSYKYSTTPNPSYLVAGDFERVYISGGSGGHGQLWSESIGDGEWHSVELRLKGNSGVGVEDGEWQVWLDGVSIYNRTNVAWADSVYKASCANCINPPSDFVGWNWISIGGNASNGVYASHVRTEQWYAIDDLVISTTYVGPDYVVGGEANVFIDKVTVKP